MKKEPEDTNSSWVAGKYPFSQKTVNEWNIFSDCLHSGSVTSVTTFNPGMRCCLGGTVVQSFCNHVDLVVV